MIILTTRMIKKGQTAPPFRVVTGDFLFAGTPQKKKYPGVEVGCLHYNVDSPLGPKWITEGVGGPMGPYGVLGGPWGPQGRDPGPMGPYGLSPIG